MIPVEPIWITQDNELADLCSRWRQQGAIAIDTEFMRSETFYPIVGLIQIGDGKGCYLIDPLAITDFAPLQALLLDEAVTKVLHSCSEDLEVFQRLLGIVPSPLFDTQIAAAFCGYGFSLGYAALVKAVLAIDIPKDETRSDWLQRPLSLAQLKYAALDVAHMLVIYGKLLQSLKATERLSWVKEDCAELVANARKVEDFSSLYHKVGFAWKLRPQQLAILQALCIWREAEARQRNIPRNRLVKEPALWEMARRQPQDLVQLQRIQEMSPRTVRDYGELLLDVIRAAVDTDSVSWPLSVPPPLTQSDGPLLKQLKQKVREAAENLSLPPEILIRKKDYEFLLRSGMHGGDYQLPERLCGWRYSVIGQQLLDLVKKPVINETAL